jgi:hypothetical protein
MDDVSREPFALERRGLPLRSATPAVMTAGWLPANVRNPLRAALAAVAAPEPDLLPGKDAESGQSEEPWWLEAAEWGDAEPVRGDDTTVPLSADAAGRDDQRTARTELAQPAGRDIAGAGVPPQGAPALRTARALAGPDAAAIDPRAAAGGAASPGHPAADATTAQQAGYPVDQADESRSTRRPAPSGPRAGTTAAVTTPTKASVSSFQPGARSARPPVVIDVQEPMVGPPRVGSITGRPLAPPTPPAASASPTPAAASASTTPDANVRPAPRVTMTVASEQPRRPDAVHSDVAPMGAPPAIARPQEPASAGLMPPRRSAPAVHIDRVAVTVQAPVAAPVPVPPRPAVAATPTESAPAAAGRGFRNPWASYHVRRD